MTTINQDTVTETYDEISRLETFNERREFLHAQSEEMRVSLWLENIERKTKWTELSTEQKEILEVIREKFITVEFAQSVKGKTESEAPPEYHEIMNRAMQLIGKDNLRELIFILGDSSTFKSVCRIA